MASGAVHIKVDLEPVRIALLGLVGASWTPELERHLRAMLDDGAGFDLRPAKPGSEYNLVAMPTVQLHRLVREYGMRQGGPAEQ